MAKTISLLNHKGGVGKTTTTLNMGAGLNKRGYKVLLVDIDGQANLTSSLIDNNSPESAPERTIYGAMMGKHELPVYTAPSGVDFVPSHIDLAAADTELMMAFERESILKKLLEPVQKKYDYILIDCPPSISILSINALKASTGLVIPVTADFYGVLGLGKMKDVVELIRKNLNPDLVLEGILFTLCENTNIHKQAKQAILDTYGDLVFKSEIRKNVQLREAPLALQNIFDYSPSGKGAEDYNNFITEYLSKYK